MSRIARERFWSQRGAADAEAAELAAYARSGFGERTFEGVLECPLPDEAFVAAWVDYAREAQQIGAATSLRRPFIQIRFPIAPGMSAMPSYVAAVRRGEWHPDPREPGLTFVRPDAIRVFLHHTAAGRVPVIVAGAREDFVRLVQALTCRNEPRPVPPAMGACIVAGYNNWDRVAALGSAFESLVGNKSLYQDRFIILSSGPYSGVAGSDVGVSEDEWSRISLTIRLEHECAHYVTRHALGTMRNSVLDELIADYVGIVAAAGRYRADWFLRFLGLESPAVCRADGRIHTYRGSPPLSEGAFRLLQDALRDAATQLAAYDEQRENDGWHAIQAARMIVALAGMGLEGLASDDACDRLVAAAAEAAHWVRDRVETVPT